MATRRSWANYPPAYQAREVALLADWIAAGESGAIVGPPGAGKSNLLGFLSRQPQVVQPHLPDDFRVVLALVDLNNLPGNDLSTFYRIILRALYECRAQLTTLADSLAGAVETLYRNVARETDPFVSQSALREALLAFEAHDTRLVLILDPFDRLAQTAEPQILDNLRGLRDSFKATLSYLVGIQQPLGYLRDPAEMGELHSLLDMHVCWLGGMAAADARFVIDNIAGAKGCVFSEADIEHLLNLTGAMPPR
jgi:Cdc6-like AAA superfamily ATPase